MSDITLPCALSGDDATLVLVGRGAVATVWRLDDPEQPGQTLGIKVARGRLRGRSDVRAAIEREFEVLRALQHPRVARAYATFWWHDRPGLLVDFVSGRSLLSRLAEGALSPARSREHGIALFDILRHVHTREPAIVHSDLSPENLIIDSDGDLHLIDFGSALVGDAARPSPGKPSYMSPEQAQGRPWNERSDLYQAGIILFEMLTGRRYNPGTSSLARRAFAANPVIDLDAHIDLPFRPVIRRLLDPDPAARWPSAAACLGALERLRPASDGDHVDPPVRQAPL